MLWTTDRSKVACELIDSKKGTYYGMTAAHQVTEQVRAVFQYERLEEGHNIIPGVTLPVLEEKCEVKVNLVIPLKNEDEIKALIQGIIRF